MAMDNTMNKNELASMGTFSSISLKLKRILLSKCHIS